jgi:hypothetical protein
MAELLKQLGAQKGGDKVITRNGESVTVDNGYVLKPGDDGYVAPASDTPASALGGRRHRRHSKGHKGNSWLAHVKATMKDKKNKGKSFKQVLKLAKKTYKKSHSQSSSSSQSGGKKRKFAHSNPQSGGSGNASASTFGSTAGAYPN